MKLFDRIHRKLFSAIRRQTDKFQEFQTISRVSRKFDAIQGLNSPFFMVGIPGSLHIMKLSAKYLSDEVNLVLVLNGMAKWEEEKAIELINPKGIINLGNRSVISHGKVLDILFDNFPKPFGILDYDCFVFNSACFQAMQSLEDGILLNAVFYQNSPILGKTSQTFFQFFNSPLVQYIRKKYNVKCGITDFSKHIPSRAAKRLLRIGIDEQNYPEYGKAYFDTFRLIESLGATEGFYCSYLDQFRTQLRESADIVHIGGVASPNTTYGWWGVRGSYFWWRALETCTDNELRLRYQQQFGNRRSQDVFTNFPEYRERTSQDFFDFVEWLLV